MVFESTRDRRLGAQPPDRVDRVRDPRRVGRLLPSAAPTSAVSESLITVVWRGRWVMLVCLVLALVAGFVYIETVTPIYTSTARLYLDYGGIPITQSYESGRMPRTDSYLYTQAEVLVSRPILGAVFESPEVRRLRTFADIDIPMAHLRENINVEVGRRDEIVSVSFSSPYAA